MFRAVGHMWPRLDERQGWNDLIVSCESRMLVDVDDLDIALAAQVRLPHLAGEGDSRADLRIAPVTRPPGILPLSFGDEV
jgi:hypothetical protein